MIPVSDELKQAVIHEVMPKKIELDFGGGDISVLNWYTQGSNSGFSFNAQNISAGGESALGTDNAYRFLTREGHLNLDYVERANYVVIAIPFSIGSVESGDVFSIRISFKRTNGSYYTADSPTYNVSDFEGDFPQSAIDKPHIVFITIQAKTSNGYFAGFDNYCGMWLRNVSATTPIICDSDYSATLWPQMYYSNSTYHYEQGVRLQKVLDATPTSSDIYATPENISLYVRDEELPAIRNENIIGQSFVYKESICSAETLKFGLCEASEIQIDVFDKDYDFIGRGMNLSLQYADVSQKFWWKNFVISEAKKSYSGNTQKRHIVAYDRLTNLNANAYSWYTQYMWGINTVREETYAPYCFDYERQIFSTYWNLAKAFGIENDDNVDTTFVGHYTFYPYHIDATRILRYIDAGVYNHELWFEGKNIDSYSIGDHDAIMVVVNLNQNRKSGTEYATFLQEYDSLGRGVETANVLLEFTVSGETDTVNFLCDSGDVIIPPENWTSVNILSTSHLSIVGDAEDMADSYDVYTVDFKYLNALDLVNGTKRLPYHSFVWRKPTVENIFKADSSITARDVMRSLMEICGCFFRLDREGHPQFLYAMEHGLYPSNTLFPADDLFPKKSSEMTMPTSYYVKADFEEYRVSNFGGVQVVVNDFNNNGTVCRWEYWGDDSSDNAYLIDDNIFLCSSQFEYEPEMAGNIETLLENLWGVLNNMSYTPFTAECIGTPFLESGDRFTLLTKNDGFESFIFERTLKGIQALKDTYEARGKNTPRVKTFEWNERS